MQKQSSHSYFIALYLNLCKNHGYHKLSTSKVTPTKKKHNVKGWHRVPKDYKQRKKWLAPMRGENLHPAEKHFGLCGKYFPEECFERDLKVKSTM